MLSPLGGLLLPTMNMGNSSGRPYRLVDRGIPNAVENDLQIESYSSVTNTADYSQTSFRPSTRSP